MFCISFAVENFLFFFLQMKLCRTSRALDSLDDSVACRRTRKMSSTLGNRFSQKPPPPSYRSGRASVQYNIYIYAYNTRRICSLNYERLFSGQACTFKRTRLEIEGLTRRNLSVGWMLPRLPYLYISLYTARRSPLPTPPPGPSRPVSLSLSRAQ